MAKQRTQRHEMEPSQAPERWQNKIVGYGDAPVDQIVANPSNWRIHPHVQMEALSGVLGDVGIVQNIVINRRTSEQWAPGDRNVETLVDGAARVLLALREGQTTLPTTYVDLTPGEEAEVLVTLDPLAAMAGADREHLAALLQEVQSGSSAVQRMLSELAAREGVVPPDDPREHWQGMPTFEQEDKLGIQQIVVHFETREDVAAFAKLVQQPITERTNSLWYPRHQRGLDAFIMSDESDATQISNIRSDQGAT